MADGQQLLFLALTIVVVLAVFFVCPGFVDALVLAALVLALYGAGVYYATPSGPVGKEGFGLPGTTAPYSPSAPRPVGAAGLGLDPPSEDPHAPGGPLEAVNLPGQYPGAIDFNGGPEYDSDAEYGFRDLAADDNALAPQGNPYNLNRVVFTKASGPCLDDEANNDEIDGDERNTYQARARNDATRVTAGTMNRRKMMEKYLSEEVLEAEEREWWGRHEI